MNTAGWWDVWHMVLAIAARQTPFVQIMMATGAVFVAVMALEGVRTSVIAIARGHKTEPPLEAPPAEPVALAMPAPAAPSRSFSARAVNGATSAAPKKRKPLTLSPRQFRSPRPAIRRHGMLDFALLGVLPENPAHAPMDLTDAV